MECCAATLSKLLGVAQRGLVVLRKAMESAVKPSDGALQAKDALKDEVTFLNCAKNTTHSRLRSGEAVTLHGECWCIDRL